MRSSRFVVAVVLSVALAAASATGADAASSSGSPSVPAAPSAPRALTPPPPPPKPVVTPPKPTRPLPARSGTGRRIVYQETVPQHVWVVGSDGRVIRDFPVSGRKDWPRPGTYRVFSKSPHSSSQRYQVLFDWMVRFAHGRTASIGFHDIPRYADGRLVHPVSGLGQALGKGGCPHLSTTDAKWLYHWAGIGTKVVVLRS